ncbi:MAG: hypothetical protein HFH41_08275 [Lachnospiraceae bacterium]|nr:hypothetical protein [Lachnospiraceae bacterium]
MTRKNVEPREETDKKLPSAHITQKLFCDWQKGELREPEEKEFLGHIGACTFCAQQFGNWMEEMLQEPDFLEEPPGYLKEEIMERTKQMDVQASVKWKETSRQVQFMMYSLKVGLAVMASIFLLMVTANIPDMNLKVSENQRVEQMKERQEEVRKKKEDREKGNITGRLRQRSREITNMLNDLSSGIFRIEMNDSENERNQEVTR